MLKVKVKDSLGIVQHKMCALLQFSVKIMGGNGDDCKQTGITPQKGNQELWEEEDLPIHNSERTGFCSKNFY